MTSAADLKAAVAAHRQGNLDEADARYARVLAAEPGHPEALRLRGVLARQCGNLGAAIQLLTDAAAAAPQDADCLCELGLSLMVAGDLVSAETALRAAVVRAPQSVKALANLGAVLQYRQRPDEAIACYQDALDRTPDEQIRANLASALLDAGRGEDALGVCDEVLSAAAANPLLRATRGTILNGLERYGEAVTELRAALAERPADDMAWVNLAYAEAALGDTAAARASLERAVGNNPDNARAVSDLMGLLLCQQDASGACALGKSFLRRHPGERQVLAMQAFALQAHGDQQAAAELLDFRHFIRIQALPTPPGYESVAAFNDALAQLISADPSLRSGPVTKATRGGGQTAELDLDAHPALSALGDMINGAVGAAAAQLREDGFADHPVVAFGAERWALRVWGTVLQSGGRQLAHIHPLGWLSGVYYVRLPTDMRSAEPNAGGLEFGQPPERVRLAERPMCHDLAPREGNLVLFPSYFYHQTRPFLSREPRISIAFDAVPIRA